MKTGALLHRAGLFLWSSGLLLGFVPAASAQLFSNLQLLVNQVAVGDPALRNAAEGPKAIDSTDLDLDGQEDLVVANTDGTVTVYFGKGGGRFNPPLHLRTGNRSLRGIVCADLNQDGLPDIAVAAPYAGQIFLFINQGQRLFSFPQTIPMWYGARNLAAGDFNGDGIIDLVVAGPNNGLRQLKNLGEGQLVTVTNITSVNFSFAEQSKFPKPVYSLLPFREPGTTFDVLAMTHAETNVVWLLKASTNGVLQIQSTVTNRSSSHALGVAPLLSPHLGFPDLICVERDAGILEIHAGTGQGFVPAVAQRIDVPGGPRAIQIVDLNGDGWNDLVVVQRNFDSIITFVNSNGIFYAATERPVGTSPRELVATRLDMDEYPDVAVMNRRSADVSILLAAPLEAGFRGANHLYLVDANVVGLKVADFNGDGRDDVIQLHRSTGDFSVRLANTDGTLAAPVYYTVGNVPSSQVFADVNNDGIADQITANLGTISIEKGSVSVRLGRGDGTFGAERRLQLPSNIDGRLFGLVPADFDGDGNIDLAAGFLDSRVAFFKGLGNGDFQFTRAHPFVTQSRELLAGDFDHNGAIDLVGVGASGEIWIVENLGDLLTTTELTVHQLPPPVGDADFLTRKAILADQDGDGELDLIIGSDSGAILYRGTGGIPFEYPPTQIAATTFSVSDVLFTNLDQSGEKDLIMSCRDLDCISIFAPQPDGSFAYAASIDAPASRFLAAGDLDGDGLPDLVGTGKILWTALSGSAPQATPPLALVGSRIGKKAIMINEILAVNKKLPVDSDDDRIVDWVEIFNGTDNSFPLHEWRLQLRAPDASGSVQTNEFTFPATAFLIPGAHLLVYFSPTRRTVYHTGFSLPAEGGTLGLISGDGQEIDRVQYPTQQADVSYARFRDGLNSFVFNPFPSPGKANIPNGLVEPDFQFRGIEPSTLRPGAALRFVAEARHDVGIAQVSLIYQRLDQPNLEVQQAQLYDDGLHGDGLANDGIFAAEIEGSFPAGSELQFYFEITDLNDQVIQVPDDPEFGVPGSPGSSFQIAVGAPSSGLEISEAVSWNMASVFDEYGGTPDWVEVRNTSSLPIPLDGISLSHDLGDGDRFYWPAGTLLNPGCYMLVYCDNNPSEGPEHAPFHFSRTLDTLVLSGLTTNKSRTLLDWTRFEHLEPDVGWARLGEAGAWRKMPATPRRCNVPGPVWTFLQTNGAAVVFSFAFPTSTNEVYVIEKATSLENNLWIPWNSVTGTGIENVISTPAGQGGAFFRLKRMAAP